MFCESLGKSESVGRVAEKQDLRSSSESPMIPSPNLPDVISSKLDLTSLRAKNIKLKKDISDYLQRIGDLNSSLKRIQKDYKRCKHRRNSQHHQNSQHTRNSRRTCNSRRTHNSRHTRNSQHCQDCRRHCQRHQSSKKMTKKRQQTQKLSPLPVSPALLSKTYTPPIILETVLLPTLPLSISSKSIPSTQSRSLKPWCAFTTPTLTPPAPISTPTPSALTPPLTTPIPTHSPSTPTTPPSVPQGTESEQTKSSPLGIKTLVGLSIVVFGAASLLSRRPTRKEAA